MAWLRVAICLVLLFISGCAQPVKPLRTAYYWCGQQFLAVEYLNDDSVILLIHSHKLFLNHIQTMRDYVYSDITGNIQFWSDGKCQYLQINNFTFPKCKLIH